MFSFIPDLYAMSPQKGEGQADMMSQLMLFGSIFMIFYFLVIRPQQKKAKLQKNMIESIKVGDEVVTGAGFYGKVKKQPAEKDYVELEIAANTVVKIQKDQIVSVNPEN